MIITANRSGDSRLFSHEGERVSNIPRRATKFFLHAVHLETDVQGMYLFREDVVREVPRKIHNPIVGQ